MNLSLKQAAVVLSAAAVAATVLGYLYHLGRRRRLNLGHLRAMQVFWYFVVGIWPVLYGLVYF